MSGQIIWYELMTPDPAGAAAFYNAVVGWDIPASGFDMPNGANYRLIGRPDGGNAGGLLHMSQAMLDHGAQPLWVAYMHVEDMSAALEKVIALGGSVLMPEQDLPAGRMAMVADPFGAPFYLMDPVPPPGEPEAKSDVFSETEPYRCGWNELASPDEQAALRFYGSLLGWESPDAMDMGPQGKYHFLTCPGQRIGALYRYGERGTPGWRHYFRVPDIRASAAAIVANGGRVTHDLHEVPGGDLIVMADDPQGAGFALVGSSA